MSSSQTFISFVVAGAGGLGSLIAKEPLLQGARVTVFTRGRYSQLPNGAVGRVVDYNKSDELEQALRDIGAEVVVSAVPIPAVNVQFALADAARKAGVKLFVPSQYGLISHESPPGPLDSKNRVTQHLKTIGLPYTVYYTGTFAEILPKFPSLLNLQTKTITPVGSEHVRSTFTSTSDIAYFVAYTLLHLPSSQLENKIFGVQGSNHSWSELVDILDRVYGGRFQVKLQDANEIKDRVEAKQASVVEYIKWITSLGLCDVSRFWKPDLVPDWTPLTLEEVLRSSISN